MHSTSLEIFCQNLLCMDIKEDRLPFIAKRQTQYVGEQFSIQTFL